MDETRSVSEGSGLPLPGLIFILSCLWLGLLALTIWAWVASKSPSAVPVPSATATASVAVGTSPAPAQALTWSRTSFNRFMVRVGWGAAELGVVLLVIVLLTWVVQGKIQARNK